MAASSPRRKKRRGNERSRTRCGDRRITSTLLLVNVQDDSVMKGRPTPNANPGQAQSRLCPLLVHLWIGLGLMSNPGLSGLWASDRMWVRPAYCLAVVGGRERTLVPVPGSLRGRPNRGRAGSPAGSRTAGGRVHRPSPTQVKLTAVAAARPRAVSAGSNCIGELVPRRP